MSITAAQFARLAQHPSGTWGTLPTDLAVEGRHLRVARDPNGRPTLLVPASGRQAGEKMVTKGLRVTVGALAEGASWADWLQISCREEHLDDTFVLLVEDVLESLRSAPEGADPVTTAIVAVERWQKLLAAMAPGRMTDAQAAGLLAELRLLEVLGQRLGPQSALDAWAGPDRSRVDFRFAEAGIEVKATLQRDRFKVSVHGILQLDPHEVGVLCLWAEQFELVPDGGDSVPAVLERLVAAGFDRWELLEGMAQSGFRPVDEPSLARVQFRSLDTRAVKVGDRTPRIVASAFVDGAVPAFVSDVAYSLDLTDLAPENGLLPGLDELLEVSL